MKIFNSRIWKLDAFDFKNPSIHIYGPNILNPLTIGDLRLLFWSDILVSLLKLINTEGIKYSISIPDVNAKVLEDAIFSKTPPVVITEWKVVQKFFDLIHEYGITQFDNSYFLSSVNIYNIRASMISMVKTGFIDKKLRLSKVSPSPFPEKCKVKELWSKNLDIGTSLLFGVQPPVLCVGFEKDKIPFHVCEIIQGEYFSGQTYGNLWIHIKNDEVFQMGNIKHKTLFRYYLCTKNYRQPIKFDVADYKKCKHGFIKLHLFYNKLLRTIRYGVPDKPVDILKKVIKCLKNDLDARSAIIKLSEFVNKWIHAPLSLDTVESYIKQLNIINLILKIIDKDLLNVPQGASGPEYISVEDKYSELIIRKI